MNDSRTVSFSIEELKVAMRDDCVTILSFYLEDKLDLAVPELHIEIWDELVVMVKTVSNLADWADHIQKVFCVPRGHAKSTLIKLAVILFFRYSPIRFVLYTSLTSGLAKAACKDIVGWLTSEKDNAVFGPTLVVKSNEQEQLWILDIGMPFQTERKRVILKALGADQQVRGTNINSDRPDLTIMDDIEDNSTAASEETQAKLDVWLMGNLLKASARRSIRIVIGNMINKRTMLYRFSQDPKWNPTVYGAIVRNKKTGELESLWPDLWPLDKLIADYKNYRSKGTGHVWLYEMMNMTQESIFKTGMEGAVRIPRPLPDEIKSGIIILDPAFGQNAWNDYAAFTVHVKVPGSSIPHIVESRKNKYTEEQLLDTFLELSAYWNLATWGIESVAAQKLLIALFKTMMLNRGLDPTVYTVLPLLSGNKAKSSRILAFVRSAGAGSYGIVDEESDLVHELSHYDPDSSEHDDLPDSAAYGPIAWAQAGEMIDEGGRLREKLALMQAESDGTQVVRDESETVAF